MKRPQPLDAVAIGIERINAVDAIAGLIHTARDATELQYLLSGIRNELREGIAELDRLEG